MVCSICNTDNPVESKFCRECGIRLPEPVAKHTVKPEEIDDLLKEGYRTYHDKNVDEALYIAEAVLSADPESSSALALKGMCHESRGEYEKAIEVFEQIVMINPDSTLDRIKLVQLRRKISDSTPLGDELEAKSKKTVAMFTGIAAALIVMTTGVLVALYSRNANASEPNKDAYASNQAVGFDLNQPAANGNRPNPAPGDNPQASENNSNAQLPDTNRTGSAFTPPRWDANRYTGPLTVNPNQLPLPGGDPAGNSQGGDATNTGATSATAGSQDSGQKPQDTAPRDEKPTNAKYEIKPSSGQDDGRESENAYRVAQQKMQTGDYRGALKDFEVSLRNSNQPGLTHQMMARCCKRLGDSTGAKSHLQTALDIYEKSGNKAGADACKRELESLGG